MKRHDLPSTTIHDELERLLNTDDFRRAPSHSRLLRYLVERSTEHDATALREAAIAFAVFRRTPSQYDPDHDPIVRVTASRLRDRLQRHYANLHPVPELMIQLPKGAYAPEFVPLEVRPATARFSALILRPVNDLRGQTRPDPAVLGFETKLRTLLVQSGRLRVVSAQPTDRDVLFDDHVLSVTLSQERNGYIRATAELSSENGHVALWAEVRIGSSDALPPTLDALIDAVQFRLATVSSSVEESATKVRSALRIARTLLTHLELADVLKAKREMETVVRDVPTSIESWATLARVCVRQLNYPSEDVPATLKQIEQANQRTLALNAGHPDALAVKALLSALTGRIVPSLDLYRVALDAAPALTLARVNFALTLTALARFDEALAQLDIAEAYDPTSINVATNRAWILSLKGDFCASRTLFREIWAMGDRSSFATQKAIENELFCSEPANALVLANERVRAGDVPRLNTFVAALVEHLRRDDDSTERILSNAPVASGQYWQFERARVALRIGKREVALAAIQAAIKGREPSLLFARVTPELAALENHASARSLWDEIGLSPVSRPPWQAQYSA
jgi:tetratricopeptide (TPR) repeat protein